jgi:hypothetical protein
VDTTQVTPPTGREKIKSLAADLEGIEREFQQAFNSDNPGERTTAYIGCAIRFRQLAAKAIATAGLHARDLIDARARIEELEREADEDYTDPDGAMYAAADLDADRVADR